MSDEAAKWIQSTVKDAERRASRIYKFGDDPITKPRDEFNMNDPMAVKFVERMENNPRENRIREFMSPPGSVKLSSGHELTLPPLLEEMRWKHGIIDAYFRGFPLFDGVVIFQLELERFGKVAWSQNEEEQAQLTNSRGVIISAGLLALDRLRSHGADIGHVVVFTRLALYRPVVATIDGYEHRATLIHDGDLRWSETLNEEIAAGKKEVRMSVNSEGFPMHKIFDTSTGHVWAPMQSERPGDYQP